MTMTTLPSKPSELIRLALKDLEACELDPKYRINMSTWHAGSDGPNNTGGLCEVCLAGAVMAQRLGGGLDESLGPRNYNVNLRRAILALDDFRSGRAGEGLDELSLERPTDMEVVFYVPDYHREGPEKFKKKMHWLADEFEGHGL